VSGQPGRQLKRRKGTQKKEKKKKKKKPEKKGKKQTKKKLQSRTRAVEPRLTSAGAAPSRDALVVCNRPNPLYCSGPGPHSRCSLNSVLELPSAV
jgi:hypothetical protein